MAENYDITGQLKTTDIQNGNITPVIEVDYVTKPHGITGKVIVQAGDYTPEGVHALVEAAATNDEAIAGL